MSSTSSLAAAAAAHALVNRKEIVELQEMDVVLGNSTLKCNVHKHPGNIHFHSVIDQYCEEYVNTPTQHRNAITTQVLIQLEAAGARFVKMEGDSFILCDERAASHKVTKHLRLEGQEKQALQLQEQEEQNRKRRASTFSTSSQDYLSPKRSKMRINHLATPTSAAAAASISSPRSSMKIWDNRGLPSNKYNAPTTLYYDDEDDNTESSSDDDNNGTGRKPQPVWQKLERNSDRIETDASWNKNYGKLQEYHSKYGHAGVSPDWEGDEVLAEWATRQRQLFREIQSGYRIATLREESRWKQLQRLNFPLNYENWHWERKYSQLKEILDGEKYNPTTTMEKLPEQLQTWLKYQQDLLKPKSNNKPFMYGKTLEQDKRERLKSLGV